MPTQRYEVTQPRTGILLAWVASGETALPESSGPFVWQATDLLDLLGQGEVGFVNSVTSRTAPQSVNAIRGTYVVGGRAVGRQVPGPTSLALSMSLQESARSVGPGTYPTETARCPAKLG